jgi:hypothetical protein
MILIAAFNWLGKNLTLLLLLAATILLSLALSPLIRGDTWSLFIPIACAASLCGWGLGKSRLTGKQSIVGLTVIGIPGVVIYAGGLVAPLIILIGSALSLIPPIILWLYKKTPVDFTSFLVSFANLNNQSKVILSRVWSWISQIVAGRIFLDPVAIAIVWSILLWLICSWSGWQLRRIPRVLRAFLPSGLVLAWMLDYTQKDYWLAVFYLAVIILLIGVVNDGILHLQWRQHKIDYAESISVDSSVAIIAVTTALTLTSLFMPSLSWQDLVNKIREGNRTQDRVAESLGLQPPTPTPSKYEPYFPERIPHSFMIGVPPEQSQNVVMTVKTNTLPSNSGTQVVPNPDRYYWRMATYDLYTGLGWASSPTQEVSLPANTRLLKPSDGFREIRQTVTLASDQSPQVYWTGLLSQSDADLQISWRVIPPSNANPINGNEMLGASVHAQEYNVVSYLPQFTAEQLRASGTDYPSDVAKRYLSLPDSVPERVFTLARNLTGAAPTPYDRAIAIETYLRTFPYTLNVQPPPPGRDVVDYFLFDLKRGYCDYYASAMVVLARAAGLPSRIVVGYVSDEYDPSKAEYIVRKKYAHSWAEVYFQGIGWIEFEPTANEAPIIRAGDLRSTTPPLPHTSIISQMKVEWSIMISTFGGQTILLIAGLLMLITLWQTGEIWILYILPSEVVVSHIFDRLERISMRMIHDVLAPYTPRELQAALLDKLKDNRISWMQTMIQSAQDEIGQLVMLYELQTYSRHTSSRLQIRKGIRTWASLRWKLRILISFVIFSPFHSNSN